MSPAKNQSQKSHLNNRGVNLPQCGSRKCDDPENDTDGCENVDSDCAEAARIHVVSMAREYGKCVRRGGPSVRSSQPNT